jgi:hypothetical protein
MLFGATSRLRSSFQLIEQRRTKTVHSHTIELDGASRSVYESRPKEVAAVFEYDQNGFSAGEADGSLAAVAVLFTRSIEHENENDYEPRLVPRTRTSSSSRTIK